MSEMENASLTQLDAYLEVFYEEDIETKIVATRKILLLTLDIKNIEYLLNHDSLLGTISRTLRDDYKKSMELCIYLGCIFYIFSNYNTFHNVLLQNQIGDATMKILEYQIQRFDIRFQEYQEKERQYKEALARGKDMKNEFDKELKKFNIMVSKQDKLFYIIITILLNMAEDFQIERKMKKRKIVSILIKILERRDFHLLIIVLLFLRKLSIIAENKDQMLEEGIVDRIGRFLDHNSNNQILVQLALSLLKNLCFDKKIRETIEAKGLIPKLVDFLKISQYRFSAIVILYLLSLDEKIRFTFAYTDCLTLVIKLIIHFPEPIVGKELIALATNLATNKRNADMLSEEEFHKVIDRAMKYNDVLLFKFIKNMAMNCSAEALTDCLQAYAPDFIKIGLTKGKNDELKLEVIGILANINMEDDWLEFLNNSFIEFINSNLSVGIVEDDIILEVIILIGNIAKNQKCSEVLSKAKMMKKLCELLIEKNEDEEFVVQIIYVILQFFHHKIGIEFVLQQEEIMMIVLGNIQSKYPVVRKTNDEVLDILREYEPELNERIKEGKFFSYNKEWIEAMDEYEKSAPEMNYNYYMAANQEREGVNEMWNDMMMNKADLDPRMWDEDSEEA